MYIWIFVYMYVYLHICVYANSIYIYIGLRHSIFYLPNLLGFANRLALPTLLHWYLVTTVSGMVYSSSCFHLKWDEWRAAETPYRGVSLGLLFFQIWKKAKISSNLKSFQVLSTVPSYGLKAVWRHSLAYWGKCDWSEMQFEALDTGRDLFQVEARHA